MQGVGVCNGLVPPEKGKGVMSVKVLLVKDIGDDGDDVEGSDDGKHAPDVTPGDADREHVAANGSKEISESEGDGEEGHRVQERADGEPTFGPSKSSCGGGTCE